MEKFITSEYIELEIDSIEIIEEERKTNADKIRAMSDEELAELLTNITNDAQSDSIRRCDYQWFEWLKEETKQS